MRTKPKIGYLLMAAFFLSSFLAFPRQADAEQRTTMTFRSSDSLTFFERATQAFNNRKSLVLTEPLPALGGVGGLCVTNDDRVDYPFKQLALIEQADPLLGKQLMCQFTIPGGSLGHHMVPPSISYGPLKQNGNDAECADGSEIYTIGWSERKDVIIVRHQGGYSLNGMTEYCWYTVSPKRNSNSDGTGMESL